MILRDIFIARVFHNRVLAERAFFSACIALAFFSFPAFSESYTFGGKKGWSEVTNRTGITTGKGRFGNESLELETNAAKITDDTDLLLNFEPSSSGGNGFDDKSGNYSVAENNLYITKKAKIGKGAAFSRNRKGGIILSGKEGSLFGTEGPAGSFSIEFWLCPSSVENGETILNWRSSKYSSGKIIYQHITFSVYQNRLQCIFSNIFEGYSENSGDVVLSAETHLIPGKWSHHSVSFEEDSGALSYKADGILTDIKFITDSGHEWETIYQAELGKPANLEICPVFTGMIDDIKITRNREKLSSRIAETDWEYDSESSAKRKYVRRGRFESEPVMTKAGTIADSVKADLFIPSQTDVILYVRAGENHFSWTENYPEWIPVKNGEKIENLNGLYFQVAAELFSSGDGNETPSVNEITLEYTTLPEPQPPYRITAEKGDGSVTLSWDYSVDDTAGGYYIYYGTRPGEYLGRTANEGSSPINAGNRTQFTISGLENGTIYYFAVSAWSKINQNITGPLSKEVFARPGK